MAVPDWLQPYMKDNAYIPSQEDIQNLEPQSREEVLLKYLCLSSDEIVLNGEEENY